MSLVIEPVGHLEDLVLAPFRREDIGGQAPASPAATNDKAGETTKLSAWPGAVLADVAAAVVVTSNVAPVVAVLFTAVLYAYSKRVSLLGGPDDLLPAALVNYLAAWLLLAIACWLLRLGHAEHVNRSSFQKLEEQLAEVQAWSAAEGDPPPQACGDPSGPCCRVAASKALAQHVADIRAGLVRPSIAWVLGTGYISLWRRLNAARALLAYLEPLDRARTRADWLSTRIAESSLPGAFAAQLVEARGALRQTDTRITAQARPGGPAGDDVVSERDARAVVSQVQYAVDDFRTDRYAGLVQARNLLLGTSGVAGAVLYALLWLALAVQRNNPDIGPVIEWGVAFYLVGAAVGLFNLLYVQAGIECSVEDYSLSTARAVVAPQLAGMAALLGVVITAMTAVAHSSDNGFGHFAQAVNFLPAAGFALSPGIVLAGFRKRTEDYKQDLKNSRATGSRKP